MSNLHYYELCFYHDEDDSMASDQRCSYCIKTEIAPVINDETAIKILFGENPSSEECELIKNLTCVMEISEAEALSEFDMEELNHRIASDFGVYYSRSMRQTGTVGFEILSKVKSSQLSEQLKRLLSYNPGEMAFIEYGEMSPEEIAALENEVSNYPALEDVVRFHEDNCDITVYMEAYDRVDWEEDECTE